ncbi:protein kinase domain-containing protein [Archangium sp.]|jgi:serine/threonine-protein kinase|uniref:protein kinase domain-containing protein n=1 Tax=Archangium sp. TaxID=1872627 RepID=UPI002ED91225
MSAPTAGDVIGGKWRIVRPAFGDEPGSEFRVEPTGGGTPRRLSLWRTLRAPASAELAHFGDVVRTGERTGNPAFLPVEDVGYDTAREALWMVREWRNGESLPSALGGLHPIGLDLPILRSLTEQLAEALAAAHGVGVAHGRLRPSRLLVTQTSRGVRLSVLDLGLESFRREDGQERLRAPRVGAAYLAPELEHSGPVRPSADVFSFGLIVRDLLATRRDGAWKGRWEHWVQRTTAPNPHERFGSIPDAVRALVPVLKSLPDPFVAPPSNYEPGGPPRD